MHGQTTGTDPEKYQRGWLAQKLSSCNSVQFTIHKTVTTDGMTMLVDLTGRK